MDIVQQLQRGIQNAALSADTVARADAAILRSIANEVARALAIVNAGLEGSNAYRPNGPFTHQQRLFAAQATSRWEHLAYDCETTLRRAILSTSTYEEAAQLIEQGRVK